MPRLKLASEEFDGRDGLGPDTLLNYYPEKDNDNADVPFKLKPAPGVEQLGSLSGVGRGVWYRKDAPSDALFVAHGSTLSKLDTSYSATTVGTIESSTRPVKFAGAGTGAYVLICDAPEVWHYDGTTFTKITDADLGDVEDIDYLGGYYIAVADGRLHYNDIASGPGSWAALGYVTAEAEPDTLLAVQVHNQQAFLIGGKTVEVFSATSNPDLPFSRLLGAVYDKGCIGRDANCVADNAVHIVGDDLVVHRLVGSAPQRISNADVEADLQSLDPSDYASVEMSEHIWLGQAFIQLDLPDIGTWFYSAATRRWHKRQRPSATLFGMRSYDTFNGRVIGADRTSGISAFTTAVDTDRGSNVTRTFTAHAPFDDGRMRCASLVVKGDANVSGPDLSMDYSDDGGVNWSSAETGEAVNGRYRWNGLGMMAPPGRTFRFSYTNASGIAIHRANINDGQP